MIFISSNLILLEYTEYYRSLGEGYPIKAHTKNLALYFRSHYDNMPITIICSNEKISYQISAYSPNIIGFPLSSGVLITSFPQMKENISINLKTINSEQILKNV